MKIGFDKAYDRVEWKFIDSTLARLGVGKMSMMDQVANIREAIQWAIADKQDTLFT
eukprot:c49381_g1_i1 orf=2-166(-)